MHFFVRSIVLFARPLRAPLLTILATLVDSHRLAHSSTTFLSTPQKLTTAFVHFWRFRSRSASVRAFCAAFQIPDHDPRVILR